jgi:hypothetical protein
MQVEDASAFGRDSVPEQLVAQGISSTQQPRSYMELVTTGSRFVPFSAGGNRPASPSGGAARYYDLNSLNYSGLDYGTNYVTIAGPNFYNDPLFGARIPSTAGYQVFPANATPAYVQRNAMHTHTELTYDYQVNIAEIRAGVSGNAIDAAPFAVIDGGPGDDRIHASSFSAFFAPTAYAADLTGAPGALLYGNDGDDLLGGGDFDDVLIGGAGNDFLDGGRGNDTYAFFSGDGHDEVFERRRRACGPRVLVDRGVAGRAVRRIRVRQRIPESV